MLNMAMVVYFTVFIFCFNNPATTEIYTYCHTLSLHDALPISAPSRLAGGQSRRGAVPAGGRGDDRDAGGAPPGEAVASMNAVAFPSEVLIRLSCFAGVFAAMALWEFVAPRRHQAVGRRKRWPGNIGIVANDKLAVRVLFPTAAVGVAIPGGALGWLQPNITPLPPR